LSRQRLQHGHLLCQALRSAAVQLREQLPQKRLVRQPLGEVPAAPQQQRLLQGPLEPVMALLHVAVLVGLRRVDRLALQAVVLQ